MRISSGFRNEVFFGVTKFYCLIACLQKVGGALGWGNDGWMFRVKGGANEVIVTICFSGYNQSPYRLPIDENRWREGTSPTKFPFDKYFMVHRNRTAALLLHGAPLLHSHFNIFLALPLLK